MKIRINQDVTFNWKLTVEGESVDLSKLELSVEITTPSNKKTEITPTIKFDTLEFNYRPKQIGEYILSAYLNRFKDGETALDIQAFDGVQYTRHQDFSIDDNLVANYVELTGDLNYGYKLDIHNVTYTDLIKFRDNAQLTSGRLYRITDYVTTTTQEGTKSAGHPFDVIVLALSENELLEHAWAIQHEGDEYFANSDLNAWKIWYCIDNDTARFEWADETNGKGVIYRMIDEFNNDVPYDFKNIQFKYHINIIYPYYYYTFASSNVKNNTDYSLSITHGCYSNTIKEYINSDKRSLNCIIFIGPSCYNNSFDAGCHENILEHLCYNNSFGNGCSINTLGSSCDNNSFGSYCDANTLGSSCHNNSFDSYCSFNTLGYNFTGNSFGNGCYYIKFPKTYNYYYYKNNHFGDGCQYIIVKGEETASSTSQVQNYNFAQGLQGTSDTYIVIDGKRNRAYETKVAKNSNGELKIYCEADLIQ